MPLSMYLNTLRKPAALWLALATLSAPAHAHEGHGLLGSHWHATDTWGLIALVSAVALAVWWHRK